ncbi:EmrB/QacA subfamily drug resistance transporter [Agromyces terreus]|uniref:EmrB/QacA subfamily drug resistance transporter n=2 Tax=Agromyces terreus TaxID=424795 RepID=A0A9X2H4W9_9MICO|nr:MDR family MFS transporter [Agromyces terreus]MCP2370099.1 EmrB/QacA subfamily drug resistance transporter [Agromyces terreus]
MTSSESNAANSQAPLMTHRQILLVIFGLMSAMFLSALDQTIVGTSMRTIADDLGGLELQAWVTTAYLITATITTPIYGKLSDLFGRRPLFIIAIAIFLLGSLLSGMSTSMYELAVFRAIQGIGAGGLMALPLAIMGDILAPRERAKYQGYFLAVFGISSVIGPLIGGLLSGTDEILYVAGWRWVFLVNLPVGVLALFMVIRFLHVPRFRSDRKVRIDWWGAAFVIVALVPLLLVAEQGSEWGWGSALAIGCYVVGAVGIVAFILVEVRMGQDALLPMKLFRIPTFSVVAGLGLLVGFAMFGAMMTIPLYLQLVEGATPAESGLLMLPMILGLMVSSIGSGQIIARTGRYRMFPILGTAFLALGYYWLTYLTADKDIWWIMVGMAIVGLGLGQLMQTLTIASQNAVTARDMGVATSASTFFRQIGGTLGTAVFFSLLFSRLAETLTAAFSDPALIGPMTEAMQDPAVQADPANAEILALLGTQDPEAIGTALDTDSSFLLGADPRLAEPFLVGFNDATVSVYWLGLVISVLAFIVAWFVPALPLRQVSAMQEEADASAAEAAAVAEIGIAEEIDEARDLRAADEEAERGERADASTGRHAAAVGPDGSRGGDAADGAPELEIDEVAHRAARLAGSPVEPTTTGSMHAIDLDKT